MVKDLCHGDVYGEGKDVKILDSLLEFQENIC